MIQVIYRRISINPSEIRIMQNLHSWEMVSLGSSFNCEKKEVGLSS